MGRFKVYYADIIKDYWKEELEDLLEDYPLVLSSVATDKVVIYILAKEEISIESKEIDYLHGDYDIEGLMESIENDVTEEDEDFELDSSIIWDFSNKINKEPKNSHSIIIGKGWHNHARLYLDIHLCYNPHYNKMYYLNVSGYIVGNNNSISNMIKISYLENALKELPMELTKLQWEM